MSARQSGGVRCRVLTNFGLQGLGFYTPGCLSGHPGLIILRAGFILVNSLFILSFSGLDIYFVLQVKTQQQQKNLVALIVHKLLKNRQLKKGDPVIVIYNFWHRIIFRYRLLSTFTVNFIAKKIQKLLFKEKFNRMQMNINQQNTYDEANEIIVTVINPFPIGQRGGCQVTQK